MKIIIHIRIREVLKKAIDKATGEVVVVGLLSLLVMKINGLPMLTRSHKANHLEMNLWKIIKITLYQMKSLRVQVEV